MNITYFIRCTISVVVNLDDQDKPPTTILVAPCAGFMTPDKQQAIAFPVPSIKKVKYAALIDRSNNNKQFEFDTEFIKEYIPDLLVLAAQQKVIQFHLAIPSDKKASLKIVGFIVPAPTDHA